MMNPPLAHTNTPLSAPPNTMTEPTAMDTTTAAALPTPASTPEKPLCQVCTTNPHKYRCPACSTLTCSLRCVQSHKSAANCSGQRNKTAYIPLERYTENTLYSDYSLLEDTARTTDNAARNRHSGPLHKVAKPTQFKLPVKLHKLQLAAGKRGTRVRFMSRGMKRAEDNGSYVDFHTEVVHWTVEVHLPIAGDGLSKVLLAAPVPESESVAAVVVAFADPASKASLAHPAAHVAMAALLASHPAMHYYWRRPNPVRGLPGRLHVPILDAGVTIKDALKNVPVLEYPVLVVTREPLPEPQVVLAMVKPDEDEDVTMAAPATAAHDTEDGSDNDDSPPEVASSAPPRSYAQPQSQAQPHPQSYAPASSSAPSPPRPTRAPAPRAHASLPAKPATLPPLPAASAAAAQASSTAPAPAPPQAAAPAPPAPTRAATSAPWRTPTWSANPYATAAPASPYAAHTQANPRASTPAQPKAQPPPTLSGWGSAPAKPAAPPATANPWSAGAAAAPGAHSAAPVSLSGWGAPAGGQAQQAQAPKQQPPQPAAGAMPSSDQVLALWQQLAAGQQEQVQRALAADFGGSSK